MENEVKTFVTSPRTTKPRHPDRLVASPEVLTRLNEWLSFLERKLKGISLTRNQLMNWIIMSHPASLSQSEIKQLAEQFFDEIRFAEWAVKELRIAKARGENIRFADIVANKYSSGPKNSTTSIQSKRKQSSTLKLDSGIAPHFEEKNSTLSSGKNEVK